MHKLYTIGFTQKSARQFFNLLMEHKIRLIADIRLNNTNQLAGFTRKNDLEYFASLHGIRYEHWQQFAPEKELRDQWLSDGNWDRYRKSYFTLLKQRKAVEQVDEKKLNQNIVLLCAEATPEHCHRSLAAEALQKKYKIKETVHL